MDRKWMVRSKVDSTERKSLYCLDGEYKKLHITSCFFILQKFPQILRKSLCTYYCVHWFGSMINGIVRLYLIVQTTPFSVSYTVRMMRREGFNMFCENQLILI